MKKPDSIIVDNPAGRRQFIRAGAAFVLAGAAVAASTKTSAQEELQRVDCDRSGLGEEKNPEVAGSDSDSGAEADRPGCGTKKPVMTNYKKNDSGDKLRVKKVTV